MLDSETLARGYFRKNCMERLLSDNFREGHFSTELLSLATLDLGHRAFPKKVRVSDGVSVVAP